MINLKYKKLIKIKYNKNNYKYNNYKILRINKFLKLKITIV